MNVTGSVSQRKRLMVQFLLNSAGDCLHLKCSAKIHVLTAWSGGFDMPERVGPLGGETQKEEVRSFECALEDGLRTLVLPSSTCYFLAAGRRWVLSAPHTCCDGMLYH